jgi:hypothetical protein
MLDILIQVAAGLGGIALGILILLVIQRRSR